MTIMFDFSQLTKFNLAKGPHKQPNENGDVCLTEAAIIAAGFEHREVKSEKDCPPCFSRVIAQYAIMLNDSMPDDLRNEFLKPFVIRLAGTADTAKNENNRTKYIVLQTINRINSYVCRNLMAREDWAVRCEEVKSILDARELMKEIRDTVGGEPSSCAFNATYVYQANAAAYAALTAGYTAMASAEVAGYTALVAPKVDRRKIFTIATKILDDAIQRGNNQDIRLMKSRIGAVAFAD